MSVDVTDADEVGQAVEQAVLELGSVEILCCFAGIVGCTHALEMGAEEWRRVVEVNTTGSFLCAQAVARWVVAFLV